jgi:outer membrane protein assembly factor BamA
MSSATFTLHADRNVYSEGDLRRSWRVRAGGGFSITGGAEEGKSYLYFEGSLSVARKKQYRRSSALGDLFSQYIVYASNQTDINFGLLRLHNLSVYRGIESREDIIPLSEQFYLGGAATLRGYRENQFHGSRVALSRWEIRFGRASYENLYFFVDGGYVFRMKEDTSGTASRENLFRAGYGFGIRTMTKLGDVDLSFGVGEKLSLQQTKVHVILGRRF